MIQLRDDLLLPSTPKMDEYFAEFCVRNGLTTDQQQYDFWAWAREEHGVDMDFPPASLRDDMLQEYRERQTVGSGA